MFSSRQWALSLSNHAQGRMHGYATENFKSGKIAPLRQGPTDSHMVEKVTVPSSTCTVAACHLFCIICYFKTLKLSSSG